MANYWTELTQKRLGRRRALVAAAGAGMGAMALSLIGCGGDSDGGDQQEASGLLSQPVDSTSKAKRGGVLQSYTGEIQTIDSLPAPSGGSSAGAAAHMYSRLLKYKTGVMEFATGEIEGDLAESWEISGDKLQITFKLRQDAKLDPRAPTNGRNVEAKDVLWSAAKFERLSTFGGEIFKSVGGLGPVESMTAPDSRTVVVKLATPDSLTLQLLTNPRYLWIYPVEAESGFDPRTEGRGSGPWRLKSFEQSRGMEYERNPDWFHNKDAGAKNTPWFDGISLPFVSEYATLFAQFRAKNIWTGGFVRKEDVVQLKRDIPELLLQAGVFPRAGTRVWPGNIEGTQFKDERVRQAASMALDRDLIIDVFDNVDKLRADGLPLEVRWHSSVPAGWDGAWLDPQSKDFGENAKYYKLDLTAAKQLLSAAGYPDGFEYDFHYTPNGYSDAYIQLVEVVAGEFAKAGIRAKLLPEDYSTTFLPGSRSAGKFTGIRQVGSSTQGNPMEMISLHYHSKGGFGVNQPPYQPEADVDAMIDNMRKEFDSEKQIQMMHEFQRVMAKRMRLWLVPGGGANGGAPALTMSWPFVGNYGAYNAYTGGGGTEELVHWWYDESKRTA